MKSDIDELVDLDEAFATHLRLAMREERERFGIFLRAGAAGTVVLALALFALAGWRPALIGVGLAVLQLAVLGYGRRTHSENRLYWLNQIVLTSYLALIVGLSLVTGQGNSFVLWFLVLLPAMAAFVSTPPTAGAWALLAVVAAVAVVASEAWFTLPHAIATTPALRMVTRVVLVVMVAVISIRVRQTSDGRIRELARSLVQESKAKRLAEHHQAEAEAARRAAEAADAAKTRALAFMSHEIRTPLHGVLGLNSLLQDTPLNDEQRRFLELARNAGEILLSLINDFLDLSKLDAHHLELESIVFDPCQLLEDRVLVLQESARQKGLVLTWECSAPRGVLGDQARVGQILLNLMGNAIKFTNEGGIVLRCRTLRESPGELWLRFEVEDTGIGIPEDIQQSLFRPFVQADVSTTRRYGGTGLGLAICKSLVEAMGGRVGLESQVGKGSLFWVELPFAPVEPARWPGAAAAQAPDRPPARPPGPLAARVLLVEDNPVNQLMAAEMLKRLGYVVESAGNGQEAVDAATRLHFDLVLMDCDMPVMDGYAATRAIRQGEAAGRHLPIVAMTAAALPGDRARCLEAGMDDYLSKPVRLADLRRAVERWVQAAPR